MEEDGGQRSEVARLRQGYGVPRKPTRSVEDKRGDLDYASAL